MAVGYEAQGNVGGVSIGYQAISQIKGVALGYQASALQDQFALANNILYAKWRGISYEFPSVQGAASTVLTNNGAGVLSWPVPGL